MDKHPKELIILERLQKEANTANKTMYIIAAVFSILTGIILTYIFYQCTMSVIVSAIPFAVSLPAFCYFLIKSKKENFKISDMYPELGITTDEQMEELLESSHRLTNYIFVSDKYIMDFSTIKLSDQFKVFKLSDIKSLKPKKVNDEKIEYLIDLKTNDGKKGSFRFGTEQARDKALKLLSTYAEIAENQKFID